MTIPDDPFYESRKPRRLPRDMRIAPALPRRSHAGAVEARTALLVNPFYAKSPHGSFGKHVLTPSLALTTVAAATPFNWRVRYWDENLLQGPPPSDPVPQVVGITVHLTFARRAYELAAWYRAQGATVVLGGLHVESCEEDVAPHADAVSVGDGVQTWPAILRDVECGAVQTRYEAGFGRAFDLEPRPRRDLLPREAFLTTASIIATRGCRNRCAFCYLATQKVKVPYQMRDPQSVAREIEATHEPYVVFLDNNLAGSPHYLRRLCHALRPLGKTWSAAVTLDVTDDPSLVAEMALSGCVGVFVGFETLRDENLARAGKRGPRTEDYGWRTRVLQDHGIKVNGSFVVGFDSDDVDTFATLAEWIDANRLECSTFHILTPYPGTPLFRQLEAEGRLLHRNWDLYDTAHVVFQPKHLTPEQLQRGYEWLYRRLFSHSSIWARRPAVVSQWPVYFGGAYLYKRSNWLWRFLIRYGLVHDIWRPLVSAATGRRARGGEWPERRAGLSRPAVIR